MEKKYHIIIEELTPFTPEEDAVTEKRFNEIGTMFSDKKFHHIKSLDTILSKEQFESFKKTIIGLI